MLALTILIGSRNILTSILCICSNLILVSELRYLGCARLIAILETAVGCCCIDPCDSEMLSLIRWNLILSSFSKWMMHFFVINLAIGEPTNYYKQPHYHTMAIDQPLSILALHSFVITWKRLVGRDLPINLCTGNKSLFKNINCFNCSATAEDKVIHFTCYY